MACFDNGTVIELPAREAITLQDVRGSTLRVTRGTLWVTHENERQDVILRVGDNYLVEFDGATVIEAQDEALLCVVGRHVDEGGTRERTPARASLDWRARVERLFALSSRSFVPYY